MYNDVQYSGKQCQPERYVRNISPVDVKKNVFTLFLLRFKRFKNSFWTFLRLW